MYLSKTLSGSYSASNSVVYSKYTTEKYSLLSGAATFDMSSNTHNSLDYSSTSNSVTIYPYLIG